MELRDTSRNEDYFKNRYNKDSSNVIESINTYNDALDKERYPDADEQGCLYSLYLDSFHKLISGYSLGLTYAELLPDAECIADSIFKSWKGNDYEDVRFFVCISIIFNIKSIIVSQFISKIDESDLNDLVADAFIKLLDPTWSGKATVIGYKPLKSLLTVIEHAQEGYKESAVSELHVFLEKEWFKTLTEGMITNSDHLSSNKYRGYWCLEAAALVKAFNLDDTELMECKYYPADMARF